MYVPCFLALGTICVHISDDVGGLQAARLASSARAIALKVVDAAERSQVDARVAAGAALLSQQSGTHIRAPLLREPGRLSKHPGPTVHRHSALSSQVPAPGVQGQAPAGAGNGVRVLSQIVEVCEDDENEGEVSQLRAVLGEHATKFLPLLTNYFVIVRPRRT